MACPLSLRTRTCVSWTGIEMPQNDDDNRWRDVPCKVSPVTNGVGGYGRRYVRGVQRSAHRATWKEAHGPIPDGMCVLHRCDNPPCDELLHLFLGTQADNMADKVAKGRQAHTKGAAKITVVVAREIRDRYDGGRGERQAALAQEYGLTQSNVSAITTGKSWPEAGGLISRRKRYTKV